MGGCKDWRYKSANKKGPAQILDIDEPGATEKFQSPTLKVARHCARKQVEDKDIADDELDPLHARPRAAGPVPWETRGQQDVGGAMDVDEEKGNCTSSSGAPGSENGYHPAACSVPDSSTLFAQLLSSSSSPARHPEWESSFDETREPPQAPLADRARRSRLTWDPLHDQCSERGFRRKELEEAWRTRLTSMGAEEGKRNSKGSHFPGV